MKGFFRLAAAGAAGALLMFGAPLLTPASALHVACGQTITQSTVLDSPLGPCAGDGIVIGADNITLDLNGFTLTGLGQASQGVGIRLAGHHGVTITNGRVREFRIGVLVENASSNSVSRLTLVDNTGGDGVSISGPSSDNNEIRDNWVARNGPFDGIGVFGGTSEDKVTGTVISGNRVEDNARTGMTGGIRLENWTWNTTVSNNTVTGSALEGIATFADTQFTTITGNFVHHNGYNTETDNPRPGDGIRAFARSANHVIEDNTVTNNGGNGIFLQGPVALRTGTVPGSTNNQVLDNRATGNAAKPTVLIDERSVHFEGRVQGSASVTVNGQNATVPLVAAPAMYDLHDGNPDCDANTWSGNTYGTAHPTCAGS